MSEWCQNKDCCYKRNQNQMRGSKGNKYYQSNKVSGYYYNMFCCQGCFHAWFKTNKDTCMNAIGTIDKQTIGVDDAWEFRSEWVGGGEGNNYFLINYLMGVRHTLTREQAQTPDQIRQDYGWYTRENSEAKPLAIQLGLAS
mgnify:CR=1 FL=1